jgi:hypothetical protein
MEEELYEKILRSFPNSICSGIRKKYEGYSGAPVFAAQYRPEKQSEPGNRYGLNGTFLVKIGSKEWTKKEEALYESLSGSALAPLLTRTHMASGVIDGQTAVAYDIAFDSLQTTKLLLDVLHDGGGQSEEETQRQIASLSKALVQWYLDSKLAENYVVEDPHALLVRMLTERRAANLLERLENISPSWSADTPQIAIQGSKEKAFLPNPLVYMQKGNWRRIKAEMGWHCPLARIHGDLHTGNIICPPLSQSDPKLIDFDQYAGPGVPFFDLAYLEFDIMRQLLPIEQEEKRRHWLSLLDFSMTEKEGDPKDLPWNVLRTWRFIEPIRRGMQQLQVVDEEYRIARWLATVAVGLNFARKGTTGRSSFERIAGLLYAAYGLACTLEILGVKEEMMEKPAFIYWLRGEGNVQFTPDLRISSVSQLDVPKTSSYNDGQVINIEGPQDVSFVRSSALPGRDASDNPIDDFFENDMASSTGGEKNNGVEDRRSATESILKVAEKNSSLVSEENISMEDAERIRIALQRWLDYFNAKGVIYRRMCEEINVILLQLEDYLKEISERNTTLPYKVAFPLGNALTLEEGMRQALLGFREICPLRNIGKLDPHYDEKRDNIARMLKELLAMFQEFFKNYKNLKEYI